MNTAFTPSKLLISVVAVAALLGGCKKNEVTTPVADTTVTTPATTTATTPATGSTAATDTSATATTGSSTTGSSGAMGNSDAGTSNPSQTAVTGTGASTMPGMTNNPANDAAKPPVRNNSGQTQGTTGSSVPAADGSR